MNNVKARYVISALVCSTLAACGGGGGATNLAAVEAPGATSTPDVPNTPVETTLQPVACEDLARQAFPNATITASSSVSGASVVVPSLTAPGTDVTYTGLPDFCKVVARVSPTPAEQIGIEVWLPKVGWNGRLLGVGSGGLGGYIAYTSSGGIGGKGLVDGLKAGFAVASTDTGHTGGPQVAPNTFYAWMHDPAKVANWGHSSVHHMTVFAKALSTAFYAAVPSRSYFDGCSTGGAQAMTEAIFYPEDYDGIHAGTPGASYAHLMAQFIWGAKIFHENPKLATKFPALSKAVLDACDSIDGVGDRVLENPTACKFDPGVLQCLVGTDTTSCLTAAELQGVRKLYDGPTDPVNQKQIYPGMAYGSEPGWPYIPAITQGVTVPLMQNMVFNDLSWDYLSFDFHHDVGFVDDKVAQLITATSPDLSKFKSRGGKLLMTYGWASQFDSQFFGIDYRRRVAATMGNPDDFFRLFMAPGVGHCGGGPGANVAELVQPLIDWVEQGKAPDRILATKYTNDDPTKPTLRTRPLCVWPQVARYDGSGSSDDASSFTCQ